MKNIVLGISIAIFLLCGNGLAQTKQTDDEKAIFALMTNFGKDWNNRDLDKIGEYLTDDCTHIDPQGVERKGREAIKTHMQWVIDNLLPKDNSKSEISEVSLRFVTSQVALMTFVLKEGGRSMRPTITLVKVKSDWKITAFHLTFISERQELNARQVLQKSAEFN